VGVMRGDSISAASRLKNVCFTVIVTTAFALGLYSLYLVGANTDKVQSATVAGLQRTATADNTEQIELALGDLTEQDLVYVVLDRPEDVLAPDAASVAQKAVRTFADSDLDVAVRLLDSGDPNFATIVAQNGIDRFPAVLVVKRDGGIVLVADEISEKNLLHAYNVVWGKTSSCDDAKADIY